MTQVPPVNIRVNVDASGVASGVSVVEQNLNALSARAKATTSAFGNFKTMALGMFAGNILTSGFMGVANALREAKQEALDTEQESRRLATALDSIGVQSEKTKEAVLANADSYYKLGFQGSEAIRAMGTLVTATGSVEQANKLMAISADFARDRHVDMNTAAVAMARATTGNVKAFTAYGITLDKTLPKNKAITKAFEELNQKIGKQAEAYAKSFAGQMDILNEKFDNIVQTIGGKILPVFNALLGFIIKNSTAIMYLVGTILLAITAMKTYAATTAAIKGIQQAYAFWTYAQAASTNVFRFALSALWTTMKANPVGAVISVIIILGSALIWAWNKFDGFRRAVAVGIQQIVQGFGYLIGGVARVIRAMSYLPGGGKLKDIADKADAAALSMNKYAKSVLDLSNKKIGGPKIDNFISPDVSGIQGNASGGDATKGGKGQSDNIQYVTVYASNTNDIAKKLSKAAKHGTPIGGAR